MRQFNGSATTHMHASPGDIFAVITDIDRLPEWNDAIERILERPATMTPGAEWLIVMHPSRLPRWKSRSHVVDVEPDARFSYRSHTEDSNPSYATWTWDLTPTADGTQVDVTWEANPKTAFRQLLAAPIRRRMLEREVATSLDRLRRIVEPAGRLAS